MKYGFVLPSGDARTAAEFAREAEQAGWDGFFVWEAIWGTDAWVSLTAAAMLTSRIRLGTMLTPLPILRPWKLAGETATLDRLSGGRVILSVGLGAVDTGFGNFGEDTDRKVRAEKLDEGLAVLTGLWAGQPFAFEGKHYHLKPTTFNTPQPPVQQPRIPIWVVGAWPKEKSMQRALRYDGLIPNHIGPDGKQAEVRPEDIREMRAYVAAQRGSAAPFDIIAEGRTPGDDPTRAAEIVRPWAEAGATWFNDAMWDEPDLDKVRLRIRQGPPKM
jgi:alkanesulfonate monooxygenase SsuD/methylene tetrahydromethanopterin reductase-like flavin-dependent oxidoreductase (luciferase family)